MKRRLWVVAGASLVGAGCAGTTGRGAARSYT